MSTRRVIGCMTGTSLDGLDASLVDIEGKGLEMRTRVVRSLSRDLGDIGAELRKIAEQKPVTAGFIARVARDFALLHAEAIAKLLGTDRADLVCVHGQTVFHAPPLSWQLMQPGPIAAAIGCPVVYDLRQADLAAGGQGAPITPIADWVLFRHVADPMAVINLGGFSNFTAWGRTQDIRGGDICSCNQLLDSIARLRLQRDYDQDGAVASAGTADAGAANSLAILLSAQSNQGRSLGTGDELAAWASKFGHLSASSLLRSACESIAEVIAVRIGRDAFPWLVAGGGVKNKALLGALGARNSFGVRTTDEVGVPAAYREAVNFAVLGALCQDRVSITIPAVTGVKVAPIAGAWVYP